jgi:hypothetical protein
MRTTTIAIATIVAILGADIAAAQDVLEQPRVVIVQPQIGVPPQFLGMVKAVEPPPGDATWVLQVVTRGGFSGAGIGNVEVTSSGQLTCVVKSAACGSALTSGDIGRLSSLLAALPSQSWTPSRTSTCSDCVQTLILLRRRENGSVRTYSAHWDQSQPVPSELRQLYDAVVRHAMR